jgi:hypothetical protein
MSVKSRAKIWAKLAQNAPATPATPATTTPQGTSTAPLTGSPSPLDVSAWFPTVVRGWGAENVPKIQQLVNILNWAIYALSAQQMDFNYFRQLQFQIVPTQIPDRILLSIARVAQLAYVYILTNGGGIALFPGALTPQQKANRISLITRALNAAGTLIPDGGINAALQSHIGGNLKEVLFSVLATIK